MPGVDFATKVVGDQLHAVADAEHGNPRPQRLRVDLRSAGLVDARWTAPEDQSGRVARLQLGPRRRPGHELAVHVRLAHAARDQLAELGAEIEDEDGLPARSALSCFAVLGGRCGHAQVSSSPYPRAE